MSINSVQLYIKGLLDGLQLPVAMGGAPGAGGGDQLTAIVTPPVWDDRTTPRVYIWGSTGNEDPETMPAANPGAQKKATHRIDCWLVCYDSIDDFAGQDSIFPTVIETVKQALRSSPNPILGLLDTETGRTSDLWNVGQKMTWDYAPVKAIEDGSDIARFDARIVVFVTEWFRI